MILIYTKIRLSLAAVIYWAKISKKYSIFYPFFRRRRHLHAGYFFFSILSIFSLISSFAVVCLFLLLFIVTIHNLWPIARINKKEQAN